MRTTLTNGTIIETYSCGKGTGDMKSIILKQPYQKTINIKEERRKEYYPFLED